MTATNSGNVVVLPTQQAIDHLKTAFSQRQQNVQEPDWFRARRLAAWEDFSRQGFPTPRQERWRFSQPQRLLEKGYTLQQPLQTGAESKQTWDDFVAEHQLALKLPLQQSAHYRIVLLNGVFQPQWSNANAVTGVGLSSLKDAIAMNNQSVQDHLAAMTSGAQQSSFAYLNTSFFQDGLLLELEAHTIVAQPLFILMLQTQEQTAVTHQRCLVVCQRGSQATIVEQYLALNQKASYFNNVVSQYYLSQEAKLQHYKLQQEAMSATHLTTTHVYLGGDNAAYDSVNISLGGDFVRNDINVQLAASKTFCRLDGLYLAQNKQLVDHHTRIEHLAPNSESHELYKGILKDESRAVFNGRIYVDQKAQKTNAFQANPHLLLSEDAVANSNPELEIYADDVKCSHGATYGNLSKQELFYLQSRGIALAQAKQMLVYAFAAEVLAHITLSELHQTLEQLFNQQLS